MDSPLRGKTAPLLSALPYFFVCGPENGQSPFSELLHHNATPSGTSQSEVLSPYLLRQQEDVRYCTCRFGQQEVTSLQILSWENGVSKGACPFRWNSKNQEVFGVLFVKLSSHKKVSAGMGRVAP